MVPTIVGSNTFATTTIVVENGTDLIHANHTAYAGLNWIHKTTASRRSAPRPDAFSRWQACYCRARLGPMCVFFPACRILWSLCRIQKI